MIIDFHTHSFPAKLAERAIDSLARRAGMMFPFYRGDETALIDCIRRGPADRAVVLNIATNPKQQHNVNDYAISLLAHPELIPFGSVHPDSPDVFEELERLKAAGIRGIKLHPEYQGFFADEERMLPLYEKIGGMGFVTVFHMGFDLGYPPPFRADPRRLAKALPAFGGAPVVAAHWGGLTNLPETLQYLCGRDVYLDTSFSYGTVSPTMAREIVKRHGADKILLGSDLPWQSTEQNLTFLECLDLPREELDAVCGGNARRILGI